MGPFRENTEESSKTNLLILFIWDMTILCLSGLKFVWTGLIQVKEEGWTGFSEDQPCQPEEEPRPCRLFYLDLHSI